MSDNSLLYEFIHHPAQVKLIEGEHASGKTSLLLAAAMHLGKPFVFLTGNAIYPDRAERAWNEMIEASGVTHPAPYAFVISDDVINGIQEIGEFRSYALADASDTEWVLIMDGIDMMHARAFEDTDGVNLALKFFIAAKLERQQLQIWATHNPNGAITDHLPQPNGMNWLGRFFSQRRHPATAQAGDYPGQHSPMFLGFEHDGYMPTSIRIALKRASKGE